MWTCDFCGRGNQQNQLNCEICYREKLSIEAIIIRIILEKETFYKTLPTNLEPNFRYKADLLFNLLNHPTFGPYLEEKFVQDEIGIDLINQTLTNYVVLEDVINYLQKTCSICLTDFPMPEICVLISCNCEFCYNCLKDWLEEMILNKPTKDWYCPRCPQKEMDNKDRNLHFLSFQRIINSDERLKSLFHDKLCNENLEKCSNFFWCKNEECTYGFEITDEFQIKIECPICKCCTCTRCKVKWHADETCEQYQIRKLKDDPDLTKLMIQIGIECPKCHMQFDLAKGGCLHFKCKNCELEFCEFCKNEFKKGKCKIRNCNQTGLHSHHPRNCAYYTRDFTINKLESMLLKIKNFQVPKNTAVKTCPTMVTDQNLKDLKCQKRCYKTVGLCQDHYKDYLCICIYNYNIDVK